MNINTHFRELRNNYFFVDVLNKSHAYARLHPDAKILHLGIGDVTMPLPGASIQAMQKAVDELAHKETFHGYGLEQRM